jgi:hypothetical protein
MANFVDRAFLVTDRSIVQNLLHNLVLPIVLPICIYVPSHLLQ